MARDLICQVRQKTKQKFLPALFSAHVSAAENQQLSKLLSPQITWIFKKV